MAAGWWAARLTLTLCLQVQRSMQGLGWGSGGEDQAAGNPTDQASAHSWPHTWSQAPAVLHGMHGLAAAALRGGLMDCFARVRAATSEMQAGTGEPQTRQDAAGRQQQQQVSTLRVKHFKAMYSGHASAPLLHVACCTLSSATTPSHNGGIAKVPSAQSC